jgi:hypothetical protein
MSFHRDADMEELLLQMFPSDPRPVPPSWVFRQPSMEWRSYPSNRHPPVSNNHPDFALLSPNPDFARRIRDPPCFDLLEPNREEDSQETRTAPSPPASWVAAVMKQAAAAASSPDPTASSSPKSPIFPNSFDGGPTSLQMADDEAPMYQVPERSLSLFLGEDEERPTRAGATVGLNRTLSRADTVVLPPVEPTLQQLNRQLRDLDAATNPANRLQTLDRMTALRAQRDSLLSKGLRVQLG